MTLDPQTLLSDPEDEAGPRESCVYLEGEEVSGHSNKLVAYQLGISGTRMSTLSPRTEDG